MKPLVVSVKVALAFGAAYFVLAFYTAHLDFYVWSAGERFLVLLLGAYFALCLNIKDIIQWRATSG